MRLPRRISFTVCTVARHQSVSPTIEVDVVVDVDTDLLPGGVLVGLRRQGDRAHPTERLVHARVAVEPGRQLLR